MNKRSYTRLFPLALVLLLASVARAQESLPALVKRVKPAVVAIATYDASGEALMTGSGFFLKPGQVVTNLHVVRGAVRAEIKTLDGKGKVFPVNGSLAVDEEGDLALLSVDMPHERSRSSELASELARRRRNDLRYWQPSQTRGVGERWNRLGSQGSSQQLPDHSNHRSDFSRQQRESGV